MNELARSGGGDMSVPNQEGTVNIPEEFLGGMSFIRYRLDIEKGVFVNDVTNEEKPEIFARLCGIRIERILIEEGELLCSSRDSKFSKDGVECASCKNINNSPFISVKKDDSGYVEQEMEYLKSCKKAGIETPEPWNATSKCSLRLVVQWLEEFEKNADGSYVWIAQPGLCYISCGKSSLINMTDRRAGYLSKLRSKGYGDMTYVVTAIKIGSRKNEKTKNSYSYQTFDILGSYADITKKCINFEEMKDSAPEYTKAFLEGAKAHRKQAELPGGQAEVAETTEVPEKAQKPAPTPQKPPAVAEQAKPAPQAPITPPSAPKTPIQTPPPAVPADMSQARMKLKMIYGVLPADVQGIVLTVLKVESIDKIVDNDVKVALETLELAQTEVKDKQEAEAKNNQSTQGTSGKKAPW
jgi:hypothetical protein